MQTSNVIDKTESYLVISPYVGSSLSEVKKEAAKIALEKDIEVRFTFNGRNYKTSPISIISKIGPQ